MTDEATQEDVDEVDVRLGQFDMDHLRAGQPVYKPGSDGTRIVLRAESEVCADSDEVIAGRDRQQIRNETLRLASTRYSVENQARIETLLWVLGYIDTERCPTGDADDDRVRELTNRGSWPFDPSLGGESRGE